MTDETPTHRHVMEKARAEIERLTRELAEARRTLAEKLMECVELRKERDLAMRDRAFYEDARDRQIEYALRVEAARDEARQERAALRSMMPSEEEITGLLAIRLARFDGGPSEVYAKAAPYLDRLAMARLSPPSAPAHRGDVDYTCEFCGCKTNARLRACCEKGHAADIRKAPAQDKENDHG